jgi:hypothetical protein
MPWKITLPSGTEHTSATVTAGQFIAVAEVISGVQWHEVEPTQGPRQLVAWIAILSASEANGEGDVAVELERVMALPMNDVITMLTIDEE